MSLGLALAAGVGLPGRRVRWLHRAAALAFVGVALAHQATLLLGAGLVVASLGITAARLPDRDWALALVFTHAAGALLLVVLIGLTR